MNVVLHIPDDFADRLSAGGDVEREALEALAAEAYRAGRLTKPELRRLLGLGSRHALEGFLKTHGLFEPVTQSGVQREVRDLQRDLDSNTRTSAPSAEMGYRRRMTVEQMLALGSEIAALPILDRRRPSQIMDELNAP